MKKRNQNPVVGDTIELNLVAFNSNNLADVHNIEKVEIYRLDPTLCSDTNSDGRYLVDTITDINNDATGVYTIDLVTSAPKYTIGEYIDVWYVTFNEDDVVSKKEERFSIYPNLWYTSTMPAVYDFSFQFQPNRIRKGSIKWLAIKIIPNVPRATDLERFYSNIAISSELKINIKKNCSKCPEDDEDTIVEDEVVTERDKVFGFYKLDTTENGLDLEANSIYDIWFSLAYADTLTISEIMQFAVV